MYMVEISSHSDIGDVKESNQDSILCKCGKIGKHNVGLYIVADGCGGLAYGEEISRLAVTYFTRVWNNELKELLESKKLPKPDAAIDTLLERAIKDINDKAKEFGQMVGDKVGTTLSLLLCIDKKFYIKNVGDSRIYLKRGNKITQITEDQSLVADLLRNNEISKDEALNFKKKNVLTMCIGVFENVRTYSNKGRINHGDTFLICCDGLYNNVTSKAMVKILNDRKIKFEDKCLELRNSIEKGKATDNVSSVVCRFKFGRKKIAAAIIILALAAVIAGVLAGQAPVFHTIVSELLGGTI